MNQISLASVELDLLIQKRFGHRQFELIISDRIAILSSMGNLITTLYTHILQYGVITISDLIPYDSHHVSSCIINFSNML